MAEQSATSFTHQGTEPKTYSAIPTGTVFFLADDMRGPCVKVMSGILHIPTGQHISITNPNPRVMVVKTVHCILD